MILQKHFLNSVFRPTKQEKRENTKIFAETK